MQLKIENDWQELLQEEFDKDYFKKLNNFVSNQYILNTCYPTENEVFNAFNYCSFQDLKIVLIGQDPYHGKGQANGLCFSVNEGIKHPPSLQNIFKELESNVNKPYPKSGDLSHWAKQGILMLNATLTVQEAKAGSHQKQGWEQFTDAVIKIISAKKQNVIFLLWGGFAIKKSKLIDKNKHYLLTSGHPSPLSANRGYWFGNEHFSKANTLLKTWNKNEINW